MTPEETKIELSTNRNPRFGDIRHIKGHYTEKQLIVISRTYGDWFDFGNIDDLDPLIYDHDQMTIVSLGRGNGNYGNIDDLDPNKYDSSQMSMIALGRSGTPMYGNIDDLDPRLYCSEYMALVSKGRGVCIVYTNIDDLDPTKVPIEKARDISGDRLWNAITKNI